MIGILIWGRKTHSKLQGTAADYCPVCRRPVKVWVSQLYSSRHFNFIRFGPGVPLERIRTCYDCGFALPLEPDALPIVLPSRSDLSLNTFIAETNPNCDKTRLRHEDATVEPQDRHYLLIRAFRDAEYSARQRIRSVHSDNGFLVFTGWFGSLGQIAILLFYFRLDFSSGIIACALIAIVLQLASLAYLPLRSTIRSVLLYPWLVPMLAPLNPDRDEMAEALAACTIRPEPASAWVRIKKSELKILELLDPDRLVEQLAERQVALATR